MRFVDMLKFAVAALYQQKVRTVLTTLGVVFGTFVLALSLSVGLGVQDTVERQFQRSNRLRRIEVWPAYKTPEDSIPPEEKVVKGHMSEAKRRRILQAKINAWGRHNMGGPRVALTPQRVHELATLDHVESAVPFIQHFGRASYGDKAEDVACLAAPANDPAYRHRIVAGRFLIPSDRDAIVVTEYLLYRWGIIDDEAVNQVPGKQTVHLEYRSGGRSPNLLLAALNAARPHLTAAEEKVMNTVIERLPSVLASPEVIAAFKLEPGEREIFERLTKGPPPPAHANAEIPIRKVYTVVGVIRSPTPEEAASGGWQWMNSDEDVLMPLGTAEDLFAQFPLLREQGYGRVAITVDSEDNVKEVSQKIAASGLGYFSLADILERIRFNVVLISFATACVAVVALIVAALGIINTMLMAVLERTHEIGVMKAVGARDGHIQLIFLVEGALIGLVGGGLGLLLSWIASIPGNAIGQSLMEKQTQSRLDESLFAFPLWLIALILLGAALVTTLAAVLPARRAARVSPVMALRQQ